MQQPIFFEHEQVQPKNLEFLNSSVEKNIKDTIVTFTNGNPGIVQGLTLTGISGNNFFTLSQGYGYDGSGERIQVFSGTNISIDFSGTQNVYLALGSVVYNPDPSENPAGASNIVTNINPDDSSLVAIENYNFPVVTTSSGAGYIALGTVSADNGMLFTSSSTSGSSHLFVGGIIDLNTQTINGLNISSGSVDSNLFTNPLTYDVYLGTDVDILLLNSGNNNIGSTALPLANVHAVTGNFHELTGMSPILVDTFWQKSGTSLEATGNNVVQIDKNQLGTRFANGITVNSNSISTVGLDKDINVVTDPLKRINLDSTVNVTSGHDLYVKDNIFVSGTAYLGTTNIVGVTGNFNIAGELSYSSVDQGYDNLVRNSNFAIPSGNITGNVVYPANWATSVPNRDFGFGPIPTPGYGTQWLRPAASLTSAMALLGTTGNYTIEATVKKFGNSFYGDGTNRMWTKFSTNPNLSTNFYIGTSSPATLNWSSNATNMATAAVIKNNQWYHIAYTWDGTTRRLWIDGVSVQSDFSNGSFNGQDISDQRVFAFGDNSANLNGICTNLAVSNVAKTVFPSGSAPLIITPSETLGYWKFENNLLDSSPNGRTMVLQGANAAVFSDSYIGQVFSGTIAGTGTELALMPSTQNVYVAEPHSSTFLLGSGLNIDPTGIRVFQPLPDLKPGTDYNLSFFMKNLSAGASGLGVNTSISGTAGDGSPIVTTLNTSTTTFSSNSWAKQTYNFTTAASGSNFNLSLGVYSTSTGTVATGIFGFAGLQVTEGIATVPYKPKERIQQINIQMPSTFQFSITGGTAAVPTVTDMSRTFYTKGGFCLINASLSPVVSRVNAPNGQDVGFEPRIALDGVTVAVATNNIPYATANTFPAGGNYDFSGHGDMTYSTYLEPGFHTLTTTFFGFGGGSPNGGVWTFRMYGGRASNIAITIFE